MNSTETMLPEGWYVNGSDQTSLRYWSGGSWTERTLPLPITEPTPIISADTGDEWDELPWSTVPAWILIASPMLMGATLLIAMLEANASGFTWLVAGLLVAPYLLTLVLAPLDEVRLRSWGYRRTATWAWAFLGAPAYLVARTMVLNRYASGVGSALWMWLVALLLTVIAMFTLLLAASGGMDLDGLFGSFTYSSLGSIVP